MRATHRTRLAARSCSGSPPANTSHRKSISSDCSLIATTAPDTTTNMVVVSISRSIRCSARAHSRHSRSEEHTSELQLLMRIWYAVFFLKNTIAKHEKQTYLLQS